MLKKLTSADEKLNSLARTWPMYLFVILLSVLFSLTAFSEDPSCIQRIESTTGPQIRSDIGCEAVETSHAVSLLSASMPISKCSSLNVETEIFTSNYVSAISRDSAICDCKQQESSVDTALKLDSSFSGSPFSGSSSFLPHRNSMTLLANNKLFRPLTSDAFNTPIIQRRDRGNHTLAALRNGVMFQGSLISGGDSQISNLYSQGQISKVLKENETDIKKALVESYISKVQGSDQAAQEDPAALANEAKTATNFEIPEADIKLLDDNSLSGDVCVSAREYLSFNQLPSSDFFFQDISQLDKFVEADWDYHAIEKRMRKLNEGGVTSEESNEFDRLKARRLFIESNPLIKNLFAASVDSLEKPKNKELAAKFEEIRKDPAWQVLHQKKSDLFFKVIKSLQPGPSCVKDGDNCLQSNMPTYLKSLKDFFVDRDAAFLVNVQGLSEMKEKLSKIYDPTAPDPTTPKDYDQLQAAFQYEHQDLNINVTPKDCYDNKGDVSSCEKLWQAYCPMVEKSFEEIRKGFCGKRDNIDEDIFFSSLNNWNPDINSNPQYKRFNDRICKKKRKTSNPAYPRTSTFSEFKTFYCKKHPNASECKTSSTITGNAKLRNEFLDIYKMADVSNHPELEAQKVAAFKEYTEIAKVKAASQEETTNNRMNRESSIPAMRTMTASFASSFSRDNSSSTERQLSSNSTNSTTTVTDANASFTNSSNMMNPNETFMQTPVIVPPVISPNLAKINPQNMTAEDKAAVDSAAEAEIANLKKQLSDSQANASNAAMNEKLKGMQDLLAEKDKSAAQYQKLIDQLNSRLNEAPQKVAEVAAVQDRSPVAKSSSNLSPNLGSNVNYGNFALSDQTQRAPASLGSQAAFGSAGGSASSSAALSALGGAAGNAINANRASTFNSALLEAQEAKSGSVQRSGDGSIILATDGNSPNLKPLDAAATDYSLSVPSQDYAGFESQNMETLRRYQEKFLTSMESNQPVRVIVKSGNKNPLEFYVVKDGSKLFFKPLRKTGATLEALQRAVKKTP